MCAECYSHNEPRKYPYILKIEKMEFSSCLCHGHLTFLTPNTVLIVWSKFYFVNECMRIITLHIIIIKAQR